MGSVGGGGEDSNQPLDFSNVDSFLPSSKPTIFSRNTL
jgi:hypothetical protein